VTTLGQTISRAGFEAGSWLMDQVLFVAAISLKRPAGSSLNDPKTPHRVI
jgi:hypothetical protein